MINYLKILPEQFDLLINTVEINHLSTKNYQIKCSALLV